MIKNIHDTGQVELLELLGDLRPDALQHLDLGEQGIEDFGTHQRSRCRARRAAKRSNKGEIDLVEIALLVERIFPIGSIPIDVEQE